VGEHDLNELEAARAEKAPEPTIVKYGHPVQSFTVPNYMDWPGEATALLSEGDLRGALTEIMGAQEFARFWALKPTNGVLYDLMDVIERDQGMPGLGESAPLNRSSRRASERSNRTSSGTTGSTSGPPSRKAPSARRPAASGA
jgi:hypothetical protein